MATSHVTVTACILHCLDSLRERGGGKIGGALRLPSGLG